MGSYNIIMFIGLIAGTGLLWLLGLLFESNIVLMANNLIDSGIMSAYTLDTLTAIMTIFKFSLPAVMIVLVIWFISSNVGEAE